MKIFCVENEIARLFKSYLCDRFDCFHANNNISCITNHRFCLTVSHEYFIDFRFNFYDLD